MLKMGLVLSAAMLAVVMFGSPGESADLSFGQQGATVHAPQPSVRPAGGLLSGLVRSLFSKDTQSVVTTAPRIPAARRAEHAVFVHCRDGATLCLIALPGDH